MEFFVSKKLIDRIYEKTEDIYIFSYYLGIGINDILYCLKDRGHKINNPLRDDVNPSLGFLRLPSGKIRMKDWANDTYSGDVFDIVGLLIGKNPSIGKDFIDICNDIIDKLINKIVSNTVPYVKTYKQYEDTQRSILCKVRSWSSKCDNTYWNKYGLTKEDLAKDYIFPLEKYWLQDKNDSNTFNLSYLHSNAYPAYLYYIRTVNGIDIVKIYMPNSKVRFITNNKSKFDSHNSAFTDKEYVIVTKSRKDESVLRKAIDGGNSGQCIPFFNGRIAVVSLSSESILLNKSEADGISGYYRNVIMNSDFDKTGIKNMFYHNYCYNFLSMTLGKSNNIINSYSPQELNWIVNKVSRDSGRPLDVDRFKEFVDSIAGDYLVKDFSDYVAVYGMEKGRELLAKILDKLI